MSDDFGKMLKKLREERGLSLGRLSELTGISPSYLNRLEKSIKRSPGFTKIVTLASALNVDPWVLAGSSLKWDKREIIGFKELLFNHQIQHNGNLLTAEEKELLLEIVELILDAEWSKESILSDLQEIGEMVSELKDL
ncbi:helix-turn-helix transcriptional regulator [Bacillus sp. APMAM]|nr:helix-turn-helix transcriptional regulator [Bacillus sp. APMAM]RTZ53046.1 XRE family transcriptional regulator [Bacillus sp. SAJ1]